MPIHRSQQWAHTDGAERELRRVGAQQKQVARGLTQSQKAAVDTNGGERIDTTHSAEQAIVIDSSSNCSMMIDPLLWSLLVGIRGQAQG